jgi:hypothetical protein
VEITPDYSLQIGGSAIVVKFTDDFRDQASNSDIESERKPGKYVLSGEKLASPKASLSAQFAASARKSVKHYRVGEANCPAYAASVSCAEMALLTRSAVNTKWPSKGTATLLPASRGPGRFAG